MTVLGVGMDVVEVDSFASLVAASGSAFESRVFTDHELDAADQLPGSRRDKFLASRFAVKEALVKAWFAALPSGAPLLAETETWAGIEVRNDSFGRPSVHLLEPVSGVFAQSLGEVNTHVSLSHEDTIASAVVIIDRTNGGE